MEDACNVKEIDMFGKEFDVSLKDCPERDDCNWRHYCEIWRDKAGMMWHYIRDNTTLNSPYDGLEHKFKKKDRRCIHFSSEEEKRIIEKAW